MPRHPAEIRREANLTNWAKRPQFNHPGHINSHAAKPAKQMVYTVPNIAQLPPSKPPWRPSNNVRIKRFRMTSSAAGTQVWLTVTLHDYNGLVTTLIDEAWANANSDRMSQWYYPPDNDPYSWCIGRATNEVDSIPPTADEKGEWIRIQITGDDEIEVTLTIQYTEY